MRRILVADDVALRALPPTVRDVALAELDRVYAFVGQTHGQQPMVVQVLEPLDFPAELDFSDVVVRLVTDGDPSAHLQAAFHHQLTNVRTGLREAGAIVEGPTEDRFASDPERLGTSSSIKEVSAGFGICIMASFVTLPGSAAAYVEDSTQAKEDVERRRARLEGDPAEMARYFASAQSLIDSRDQLLWDNGTDPGAWPPEDQERFGAFLGRAMAHEARHLLVPPHADAGLGASGPDLLDDTNYGAFSTDDQRDIIDAVHVFEREQSGARLIPVFPQATRATADAFPF